MEIFLAKQKHIDCMTRFFEVLQRNGDTKLFHPHSFERDEILKILKSKKRDLYYIVVDNEEVLGYGILRGWDEGYSVPSLGIAISPEARGTGLGKMLMQFLHLVCRFQGCEKIRLKVYKDNTRAINMYERLGYKFLSEENGQLIGYYELGKADSDR